MSEPGADAGFPGLTIPAGIGTSTAGRARPSRPPPQVPDHELLQLIGGGAYGEVWLARNVLGTFRAVKVVHREDFSEDYPFEREFRGIEKFEPVSRSHDGLVDILQIGRHDEAGCFYYVMELADDARDQRTEGGGLKTDRPPTPHSYAPRTLRGELKARGRLPPEECLQIGLSLSSALAHLHENGLVHRDVKPSNIIFVNGVAKLADIGLVAEVDEARSFVGTVGFIPPEGPGAPQADIYSLGKVLYEMVTGQDRGKFPDLPADLKAWPEAGQVLELNQVILKACAGDLRQRYPTARRMHEDLALLERGRSVQRRRKRNKVLAAAARAGLVLAALGLGVWVATQLIQGNSSAPGAGLPEKASVFVLPFRNAGTNGVDESLRSRMTDAFIDSLALIDGVRVGPRKSGWVYRNEDEVRRQVGKAFGVKHALVGRVATPPGRVSLEVSLFQTDEDKQLWSETFAGGTNEVVELETKALERIASCLGLSLTATERQKIHQKLTNNLEALRYYLEGFAYVDLQTTRTHPLAAEAFSRALQLDPNYLDADVGAGYAVRNRGEDQPHRQTWAEVRAAMLKVLRMDDTHFGARHWLCAARGLCDWDWEAHERGLEELRKENPPRHFTTAVLYRILGRTNEARSEWEKYEQGGKSNLNYYCHGAAARCYTERRYDEALRFLEPGLRRYPNHPFLVPLLAEALIGKQDYTNALAVLDQAMAVERKQGLLAMVAYACARKGDEPKAREKLRELEDLDQQGYLQPYYVARVHAALGDKPEVWRWLNKAVEDRSEFLVHADMGGLRTDPAWDGLRDEPEFKELLKKVGLDVWPR